MSDLFESHDPQEIMTEAMSKYKPVKIFACFSGGHDSICSTNFAMQNGAHQVLHINTGIGIEKTRIFVRETCKKMNWPLLEVTPPDKTYEDFVMKYGFPGPGAHKYAYIWLKERALMKVIRETKIHRLDKVMFVTGVRQQESTRRMGHVRPIQKRGSQIWVAPIIGFSKMDCSKYMKENNLPRNEVVDLLHMSGECLCGSYARENELEEIRLWFPDVVGRIERLQEAVKKAGKQCVWGPRNSMPSGNNPLCVGCEQKAFPFAS